MRIEPFTKLGHVSLDANPGELCALIGNPLSTGENRVGLEEFDYGDKIFRFESNGLLSEVTIEAKQIELDRVSIPFTHLADYIAVNDPHSFEKYGFVISPVYGIAFDPEHRHWVTVLTKRGLGNWTKL